MNQIVQKAARACVGLFASLVLVEALAAQSTVPAADEAKTAALVAEVCAGCHEIERVSDQRLSAAEWQAKVTQMIGFGAAVSDADAPAVVAYLARHYGPSSATGGPGAAR